MLDQTEKMTEIVEEENVALHQPVPDTEEEEIIPQKPVIIVRPLAGYLEAELELEKSGLKTLDPEYEDIVQAIADAGIVYGVIDDVIQSMCSNVQYNVSVTVARGIRPQTGADGYIEYLVETDHQLKPRERPDGTVDFRDLGFTRNVEKDQVLCILHAPEKGDDGMDIYGNVLEGKFGKSHIDPKGKNTYYNEEQTELRAAVSGNVEEAKGVVSVVELLRINGNVDNATGDINFVGDIYIAGDVLSGFKVVSKGSVTIKGTVEGATIEAEHDITVNEGINGMNRGSLTAGGSIKCKYIQSCFIKSGVNIYADSIMYCMIECAGDLELKGKRGTLIGGRAAIAGHLTAQVIGTDSHISTFIAMGSFGSAEDRLITDISEKLKEMDQEDLKLTQIINRLTDLKKKGKTPPDVDSTLMMVLQNQKVNAQTREDLTKQLEKAKENQLKKSQENSYIECKDRVHTGVQFAFGPLMMTVSQSFVYSRISVVENNISVAPLSGR